MNFLKRAALASLFAASAMLAPAQTVEYVSNEILVKFRGSQAVATNSARMANAAINARTTSVIPRLIVDRVRIPAGMSLDDALFYYSRLSTVEYAEKNTKKQLCFAPNDSQYNNQYAPQKMKLPQAWDLGKGSASIIVAVLDTGIDLNHEDLKNKLVPGFDFSDNDSDPTAAGDHGVHCAGIAAAETNNGKGVAGIGFNSKIMPLKIFPNATDAVSAAAIIHAADHGAKVISMSYGAYGQSTTERNAVNYAWGKGVVLVGGAANDNVNMKFYPGAFDNVICVGATGVNDVKSSYSNYGADWVDVAAPGDDILSTVTGGYAEFTGTSMSTPQVAGLAALLRGAAPNASAALIRNVIETTTDPVPGGFFKNGRVNAFKAMQQIDPGSATLSNPTAVSLWEGSGMTGSAVDMLATDGNTVVIGSVPTNLGQVASASVDIAFNGPASNLRESLALLEVNAPSGVSGQLFLWNWTSSKYVSIRAFAVRPSGVKREKLVLPLNLTPYVSGGNMMRVGLKAIGPKRAPRDWPKGSFDFSIGFMQVSTRENL